MLQRYLGVMSDDIIPDTNLRRTLVNLSLFKQLLLSGIVTSIIWFLAVAVTNPSTPIGAGIITIVLICGVFGMLLRDEVSQDRLRELQRFKDGKE